MKAEIGLYKFYNKKKKRIAYKLLISTIDNKTGEQFVLFEKYLTDLEEYKVKVLTQQEIIDDMFQD